MLSDDKIKSLEAIALKIRRSIIEMLTIAGSGHTAGPLGMTDVFTALYFDILKHSPEKPDWSERDRLILSNGHICPVLYAAMAYAGYFPVSQLLKLRQYESPLQGHPWREMLPGLDTSSGPLGSGLSQGVGMAMADRLDNGKHSDHFFYVMMSDGELNCGNTWEAVMLAGKEELHNLIAIIDRNNIQIDGFTEEVMPLEPLAAKWEAFNWHVLEIDGHNFQEIANAVGQAKAVFNRPTVIIAHTIPGKGVLEFERKVEWHGKAPDHKEAEQALKELRSLKGRIRSEHD
ncbi:MAG: transketolase [bacterium]